MKKMTLKFVSLAAILATSSLALADDGVIRGRAGLSRNDFTSLYSGGPLKSTYNSLNLGVTYIQTTGWYYDLALKNSLSAKWELTGERNPADVAFDIGSGNDSYKRNDTTLTIGKALDGGIQVFGGYQRANSTMDLGPNTGNYLEKFNVNGLFVGAGKTIPMSVGSININGAIGQMKGKLLAANSQWYTSDTGTGFSLGLSYSYPLSDKSTLSLEYKRQAYKYEFTSGPSTGGDDKLQSIGANISYQF